MRSLAAALAILLAPLAAAGQPADSPGAPTVHVLPNGATLIHRRNTSNQIVALAGYIRGGAAEDGEQVAGRTNLMARVLSKGTKTRTSDEIAGELEAMGASLSASAAMDCCALSLVSVKADFPAALGIYADVLAHPSFPVAEIETERKRVLADIRQDNDSSSAQTMKRLRAEMFEHHPYGRPVKGEPETVARLGQSDLGAAHAAQFQPSNMIFAIVGDLSEEEALSLATPMLGSFGAPTETETHGGKTFVPRPGRREFTKAVEQGFVAMGHVTCGVRDDDAPALNVAAAILGQGMSSRLFVELRDKQSLAYAVGAYDSYYDGAGTFIAYIGTGPATIDHAADGLWEQVRGLREAPVSADELDRARTYLAGSYLRQHETNMGQASHLAHWQLVGLGVEYDAKYPELIKAVTTRDVMRVANRYFVDPTTVILRPAGK